MGLWLFSRRTFIWRYCIIVTFLVYVLSIGAFIPLLSSTPKTHVDLPDPASVTGPTVATRHYSPAVSLPVPSTVGIDGRRPLDAGAAAAAVSTKPTKLPTKLEVLYKNMTLHKANMSDILKHVKAAVANHSDDTSLSNRKVNNALVLRAVD